MLRGGAICCRQPTPYGAFYSGVGHFTQGWGISLRGGATPQVAMGPSQRPKEASSFTTHLVLNASSTHTYTYT